MGGKYEVMYWDWTIGKEVTYCYTNSFIQAMRLVLKLSKKWGCVTIKFRLNRMKKVKEV